MTETIKIPSSEIAIDPKNVAVYLGYYGAKPDSLTDNIMCDCTEEFLSRASFIACYAKVSVKITDYVDLGFMKVKSESLRRNLQGCDEAYIMAATTGIDTHRLIEKNQIISPVKGVMTDCIGSAAIEAFCDKINLSFENCECLRPRFSPGYGDLSLEYQHYIVEFLQTKKNIGMSLTESFMMVPVKSVTAIIGISKEKNKCTGPGCMKCSGVNCPYR